MTRGDIFMVDFGIPFGSEVGYRRPVIIIQSDKENLIKLNTTLVIPLTSNTVYADYKGNVYIKNQSPDYQRILWRWFISLSLSINSVWMRK